MLRREFADAFGRRRTRPQGPMSRRNDRGFTVVEVLVALTAAAMILAAIANLAHGSARLTGRASVRVAEVALAQALFADPADRAADAEPRSGVASGGLRWRLALAPSADETADGVAAGGWTPAVVRLDVRDPGGGAWSVETIRLVKAPAR